MTAAAQTPAPSVAQTRAIWRLEGADRFSFLQGLVSNDVLPLQKAPGIVWAALLSPQGKYLADFFIIRRADLDEDGLLIDLPADLGPDLLRRLTMYKLRSDVKIMSTSLTLSRGLGDLPPGALPDPRDPALGWRFYGETALDTAPVDWNALRVAHMIPEYPTELQVNDSFILEADFERLNGVNFRKGCYVGQEVTARMKHKTELRKGFTRVGISGMAAPGTPITLEDGREAGKLGTVSGNEALAYMRFDRLTEGLRAGDAQIFPLSPKNP